MTNSNFIRAVAAPQAHRAVIFFDWHGVLCSEPFWHSILRDPQHPLCTSLAERCRALFGEEQDFVIEWMLGRKSSREVVAWLTSDSTLASWSQYLQWQLLEDCRGFCCRREVLAMAREARPVAYTVVATDNMDCFATAAPSHSEIRTHFDAVLCSSSLGVLKAQDPERFFGPFLRRAELTFHDAVLIDDSASNCEAFRAVGGHAIQFSPRTAMVALEALRTWIRVREGIAPQVLAADRQISVKRVERTIYTTAGE